MRKNKELRRRIEDADLTQRDLVALTGIGESTLSMRLNAESGEKGEHGNWRKHEILEICRAAKIPRKDIGDLFFPELPE